MSFRFFVVAITILYVAGCDFGNKDKQQEASLKKGNVVSDSITQRNLIYGENNADSDSVFFYFEKAKLLPQSIRAVRITQTIDSSRIGSLDFYAEDISSVFSQRRIEKITPVLLFYVETLFNVIEENALSLLSEEFDNMPESAQRAAVQDEIYNRASSLERAKNILEAVLGTGTEQRAEALLLYGVVLYNLGDYEDNVEIVYSEYLKMMQEKGLADEVPAYVTNPEERSRIGEDW